MQLTNLILIVLFINILTENIYPNKYDLFRETIKTKLLNLITIINPICVNFGYNMIYCYSCMQIYVNKFIGAYSYYLNDIMFVSKPNTKIILEFYEEGINIKTIELTNKNEINNINHEQILNHDLIILSDNSLDNNIVNKIQYNKLLTDIDYTISSMKFMSINVMYNDIIYPVELKTDSYNYYIVNNQLNSNFFKYYLTNILNIKFDKDNFNYTVSLIDHNVNFIDLTHKDYIKILENDYEINSLCKDNLDILKSTILSSHNLDSESTNYNDLSSDKLSDKSDDFVKLD
jgi:hypothetical protein